jgi:DNA-binding SARP family transcriptional activator/TolB-like protein
MHVFRMLGGLGLSTGDSGEVDALLRQPKRVALLAYLAMPRPGTWHRRDSLLATFWPEHDSLRARTALRSALYTLRRHLADGAIRTRGDDEVSLDPELIETDVAALIDDVNAGRNAEAVARYTGDLLPGFHIDDAEDFEKWLGQERSHLNALARKAALALAETRERLGDLSGAIEAARRAYELDPDDEAAAQRLIALLDRSGDRTQAFAAYEKFRKHVAEEFGTRPSAETIALVDAIRVRREASSPTTSLIAPNQETLRTLVPESNAEPRPPTAGQLANIAANPTLLQTQASPSSVPRGNLKWLWAVAVIALIAVVGAWSALRGRKEASASVVARSLVVLPAENETGDRKLDYIGAGIAEGVARRLEGIGGLRIRSGARSDWPTSTLHDYKTISREFGSTVLLRTTLGRVSDSLEARAAVVDATTSGERLIAARRFGLSQIRDVESALAADVAGAVFRVPLPSVPRRPDRRIDPESYRLMLEGWQQLMDQRDRRAGKALFQRAVEIDPTNARAWAGLSSAWAVQGLGEIPFDIAYDRSSAAAARALALDSLQSSAWGNLAIMRAFKYRSLAVGLELIEKATAAEPGNPEIFLIKSTLFRHAHDWDQARDAIRVARALDPLSPVYADREGFTELCADRPEAALKVYQALVDSNPTYKGGHAGLLRSLVRLGRYDEAIAAWRKTVDSTNRELVDALARGHGKNGYWAAKHVEGKPGLAAIEKEATHSYVAAQRLFQARFLAGDLDGGFKVLEAASRTKDWRGWHLPCGPGMDEVRQSPRFKAILEKAGALH